MSDGTSSDKRGADKVDTHVGQQIRIRRKLLRLSQQDLAERIDISFQQVQKYESGLNRISASRLYDIARVLGVTVDFFFTGLPNEVVEQRPDAAVPEAKSGGAPDDAVDADPFRRRETLQLVRGFWSLKNVQARDNILDLIETLAATDGRAPH